MPRLAEYVLEEARGRNPSLAYLDRLAELMPARRMMYWPYLMGVWSAE